MSFIEFCTGKSKGRQFFAFLSIPPENYHRFLADKAAGKISNLTIYGDVLETGWGLTPPAEVIARIDAHENMVNIESHILKSMAGQLSVIEANADAYNAGLSS